MKKIKRPFILVSLFLFMATAFIGVFPQQPTYAQPAVDVDAVKDYNRLALLGLNCHNMKRDSNTWKDCEKHQDALKDSLKCGDGKMFKEEDISSDPNNTNATEKRWFTKPDKYQECYDKAYNAVALLGSAECSSMRHGWDDGGKYDDKDDSSWKKCEKTQDQLMDSLSCKKMFEPQPNKKHYYRVKSDVFQDCMRRLSAVAEVKIMTADGETLSVNTPVGAQGGPGTIGFGDGGGDQDVNICEGMSPVIGWIVCPVVRGAFDSVDWLDRKINELLTIDVPALFQNPQYKASWSSFRSIALGIVVIASLIIIISTALGYEILDAYTIRKVLPRILTAIIFMVLSWSILEFVVTLTNDVGNGIRALIYLPFSGMAVELNGFAGLFGWGALLGGIAFSGGIIGFFLLILTALLAALIALVVLVLRELIVVFLVLVAPIAIACMILPNTRKVWGLWQTTFISMMVVFPIIAGMIATGRVFAATVTNRFDGDEPLQQIIGVIAYILPYFLLPFAFKVAGGLMATLAGLANDPNRGMFDRLKNARGQRRAQSWDKAKNFSYLPDKGPLKGINTALGAAANPKSMLRGRGGVIAARSSRQKAYGAQYLKDNEVFQANQGDDAFLLALANRNLAKQKRDEALDKGDHETVANYDHALNAASQLGFRGQTAAVRSQALSALAKTGYQFSEGQEGYEELSATARDIAGNDDGAYSSLMNEAQYGLRTASRYDLAGINHGAGFNPKAGTDKASLYELANGKVQGVEGMIDAVDALPVSQQPQARAVLYKELEAMKSNSKGATRDKVVEAMEALESTGIKQYMWQDSGQTQVVREKYEHKTHQSDPSWTRAEQMQGWRAKQERMTNEQVAQKTARSYERPDPNKIP